MAANREREGEIVGILKQYKDQEPIKLVRELLALRRETYRDRLEKEDSGEHRGKAQECKDLIQKLS